MLILVFHLMSLSDSHHVSLVLVMVTYIIINNVRGLVSGINYEVIRPLYVSTTQPEVTRVSFEELTRPRVGATYSCTVYAEGRTNITSNTSYDFVQLGSATSTVTVTGE